MTTFTVRELGDGDADSAEFAAHALRLDERILALDGSDIRRWDDMTSRHLRLVAQMGGDVVATASASTFPGDDDTVGLGLVVSPDHRRQGIGRDLYWRLHAWATTPGDAASELRISVPESDAASVGWWQRRGFVEHDRYRTVEADVRAPRDLPLVDGIEFSDLERRPDLVRASYEAMVDSHRDMPGMTFGAPPFETWIDVLGTDERPPASVIVALDGDRVVGMSTLVVHGNGIAHTGFTGVLADVRGRGVGHGLKARQVDWCARVGIERLRTVNHDDNAAMRAINDLAGFHVVRTDLSLAATLSPGT